jgi:hypothetical protein
VTGMVDPYAEASVARRSFPDFCARMDARFANPPPFMRLLMDEYAALLDGRTRFLALSIPPRHTKTTLGCVLDHGGGRYISHVDVTPVAFGVRGNASASTIRNFSRFNAFSGCLLSTLHPLRRRR